MGDIIVAVDAMGGDLAPLETVKGCVLALEDKNIKLAIVGKQSEIDAELSKYSYDKTRISVINASEVIQNDDTPTAAIKEKKDSSMVVGLNMLKNGEAGAFVSAGNTGALLTGATVIVGRIKGVKRPALATIFPNTKGYTFLIDVGANVDAKPEYLVQFAQMGSVYMENVMNVKNPRVGLINIGAEKGKGNELTKEAYALLENAGVNFVGNVEAREIPLGEVDVAVCDAFVGNVVLKYSEGLSKGILSMLKEELMATTVSKIGALLSKGAYEGLKKRFDYREVGGAPFLGVNGLVVKAHGSSDAKAFKNAIKQCSYFIEKDIAKRIEEKI